MIMNSRTYHRRNDGIEHSARSSSPDVSYSLRIAILKCRSLPRSADPSFSS